MRRRPPVAPPAPFGSENGDNKDAAFKPVVVAAADDADAAECEADTAVMGQTASIDRL